MTGKPMTIRKSDRKSGTFPDFPPRDDMQNWLYLYRQSVVTALNIHFGGAEGVTVACEVPLGPSVSRGNIRIPDLMVVFGADTELVIAERGYSIESQGRPPEFVLEVASPTTGVVDYTAKRRDYERFGVGEYWRFDPSGGDYHDAALAGDLLVDGRYEPIDVECVDADRCRGYSAALGLYLCWEDGLLRFYDGAAGEYIGTHEDAVARADEAEAMAEVEAAARRRAEERAEVEAAARRRVEARADAADARAAAEVAARQRA